MTTIGLFEAKTRFSEICRRVAGSGEEILVTLRGRPLVRLLPPLKVSEKNPVGILTDLALHEKLHGSLQDSPEDFPEVWRERTSSEVSPLDKPRFLNRIRETE
jgi:prevent-host-death family protein